MEFSCVMSLWEDYLKVKNRDVLVTGNLFIVACVVIFKSAVYYIENANEGKTACVTFKLFKVSSASRKVEQRSHVCLPVIKRHDD